MYRMLSDLGFTDIEISYYGKNITKLRARSKIMAFIDKIRLKLIEWNFIAPFSMCANIELSDPLERAVTAPYKAHIESDEPAWWLRALARKI